MAVPLPLAKLFTAKARRPLTRMVSTIVPTVQPRRSPQSTQATCTHHRLLRWRIESSRSSGCGSASVRISVRAFTLEGESDGAEWDRNCQQRQSAELGQLHVGGCAHWHSVARRCGWRCCWRDCRHGRDGLGIRSDASHSDKVLARGEAHGRRHVEICRCGLWLAHHGWNASEEEEVNDRNALFGNFRAIARLIRDHSEKSIRTMCAALWCAVGLTP